MGALVLCVMRATFRPLPTWPHQVTNPRRDRPFSAPWSQTMELLDRELNHLDGSNVLIAAGWRESDLRLDGMPRADAREPSHPGVELSFDSKYGRLVYPTDVCNRWWDNVRSIALGLQALRAVDRYGVSQRGQQYAGWKELPSGSGRGVVIASRDAAWEILRIAAGISDTKGFNAESLYRQAAKKVHPDSGGTDEAFLRVRAAYELIRAA